jgi:hypothetical protein
MNLLLTRYPSCGNHEYSIEVYDGNRIPLNNEMIIDNDDFCEGRYEECSVDLSLDTVKERMEDIGEDPDVDESREIYDMLYKLIRRRYKSKYTSMINELANASSNVVMNYVMNNIESDTLGYFGYFRNEGDTKKLQGFVFKTFGDPLKKELECGQEIYVVKVNNGHDCMTTNAVLGIFFNRAEAELLEEKVKDALKEIECEDDHEYGWCNCTLQQYILESDLKSFRVG